MEFNRTLEEIFSSFNVSFSTVTKVEECFTGHINRTFFVTTDNGKYVLQKINTYVFPDTEILMHNIVSVTEYIEKKNPNDKNNLRVIPTKEGESYLTKDGGKWRVFNYIEGENYQSCPSVDFFKEVGRAFGHFAKELADFDASTLGEVIPNFHNTVSRYRDFLQAVEKDASGRKKEVEKEIKFVTDRKEECGRICEAIERGELPLRVTHNDTKLNNIMVDAAGGKGVCVIDLDTVMPGSVLYDFGDSIRFGASSAAEDETDLSKVYVRTDYFAAYAQGYIEELKGFVTDREIELLPLGAKIITLETGIRFLTDYLNGDVYFRTKYPTHNLDRARNQFKLVEDNEKKEKEFYAIVEELMK